MSFQVFGLSMVQIMEQPMSKRLGDSPKRQAMSITVEARDLLWAAVPPGIHDNRKSWLARAARLLGWSPRRVRAIWHCEARVITADEWRTLNQRLDALKAAERRHGEQTHELREAYRMAREDLPLAGRAAGGMDGRATDPGGARPAAGDEA